MLSAPAYELGNALIVNAPGMSVSVTKPETPVTFQALGPPVAVSRPLPDTRPPTGGRSVGPRNDQLNVSACADTTKLPESSNAAIATDRTFWMPNIAFSHSQKNHS